VRIGENFQLSYSNNIKIGNQSEGNEISLSYRIQPIVPVYDIAGNFGGQKGAGLGNALNPVAYRVRAKITATTIIRSLVMFIWKLISSGISLYAPALVANNT
jgi:hypothetical protein